MVDPFAESAGAAQDKYTSATGYRSVPYFLSDTVHERFKAAWWGSRDRPDGAPTLSSLVERSFIAWCDTVEAEFNDGESFDPAPPRAQGVNPASSNRRAGTEESDYRTRSYYLRIALHQRLKAAWWGLRQDPAGYPSLSLLVEAIFEATSSRLENAYNNGAPFPPAPARARGTSAEAAQRQGEWLRREWQQRRDQQVDLE